MFPTTRLWWVQVVERLANARDRLSFFNEPNLKYTNSPKCFSATYFAKDEHKQKWKSKVKAFYGSGSQYNTVVQEFNNYFSKKEDGRCFGMNAVSVLDKYGKIAFNENFPSASSMKLAKCSPSSWAESAITYYHASQVIPFLDIEQTSSENIGTLLNKARNADGPSILNYIGTNSGGYSIGHSVVINSCEYSGGNYKLNVYDPDVGANCDWVVSPTSGHYTLVGGGSILSGYIIDDIDQLDFLDIDGYQNSKSNATSASSQSDILEMSVDTDYTEKIGSAAMWGVEPDEIATVLLPLDKDATITNSTGETLIVQDGELSGDMKIYFWNFIAGTSPLYAVIVVPASETYKVETSSLQEPTTFRIADKYRYQLVDGFSGTAELYSDGSMDLIGNLQDLKIKCFRAKDEYVQFLTGNGSESVRVNFEDDKLIASGMEEAYVVGWIDESGLEQSVTVDPSLSADESGHLEIVE